MSPIPMNMRKFLLLLAGIFLCISLGYTQIPPGYYDAANGLYRTALQAALHNIIKNHTSVTYSGLWYYFQTTDKKSNNTVWDMYSDIPYGTPPYVYYFNQDECGTYQTEGDCFNREHSWPKSWFGGEVMPMYTDMFHIYPVDGYVNGMRSDYPYAKVNNSTWTSMNGSKVGPSATPGYSGTAFEPLDEYKGDFARSYFYMSVRYYTEDSSWPGSDAVTGSQLNPWALTLMMQWNSQDPVSQKETERNNAIYQIQHNRNPFIDHPEYAEEIWGANACIGTTAGTGMIRCYPNPATDKCFLELPARWNGNDPDLKVTSTTGIMENIGFSSNGTTLSLDITTLPAGIYITTLTCKASNKRYFGKIVKE